MGWRVEGEMLTVGGDGDRRAGVCVVVDRTVEGGGGRWRLGWI